MATTHTTLTIRRLSESDAREVRRLEALDTGPMLEGPMLGAEVEGRLLAAVSIVREVRGRDVASGIEGHDHPARSAWPLVLPVLAALLIAPPPLGSDPAPRPAAAAAPAPPAVHGLDGHPPPPPAAPG